jgi:SAM-dependent methyltransferase
MHLAPEDNMEAIEAWNTVLFDKFVQFRVLLCDALGIHGDRAMDQLALSPGTRVVDIGCGFGDTAQMLADRVGPEGEVVGIDAAPRFIDIARAEANKRTNVRFEVADVEASVPGGPYDHAYSRMGTMFFASPVFALRNIRKALRPGGTLAMAVWRKKEVNEAFYGAELVVRVLLGDPPKNDAVTCGPGPFSMGSADLVSDQLLAAGYTDITFTRSDAVVMIGRSVEEAIDFSLTIGPAGEIVRLSGDAGVARHAEISKALRGFVEPFLRDDGTVHAPTSCWLVAARSPA